MRIDEELVAAFRVLQQQHADVWQIVFERIGQADGNDFVAHRQSRQHILPTRRADEIRNDEHQRTPWHDARRVVEQGGDAERNLPDEDGQQQWDSMEQQWDAEAAQHPAGSRDAAMQDAGQPAGVGSEGELAEQDVGQDASAGKQQLQAEEGEEEFAAGGSEELMEAEQQAAEQPDYEPQQEAEQQPGTDGEQLEQQGYAEHVQPGDSGGGGGGGEEAALLNQDEPLTHEGEAGEEEEDAAAHVALEAAQHKLNELEAQLRQPDAVRGVCSKVFLWRRALRVSEWQWRRMSMGCSRWHFAATNGMHICLQVKPAAVQHRCGLKFSSPPLPLYPQVMEPGIMERLREYVMANGHPQAAVEYLTDSYVGE